MVGYITDFSNTSSAAKAVIARRIQNELNKEKQKQMTETTALTTVDPEMLAKLRAMAGQFVGGSTNFIPKLNINKASEDKFGNELPVGGFSVSTKDGVIYGARKAPVQFRLYAQRFGYTKFDATVDNGPGKKKGATTSRSVQLPDFKKGSEYISDDGTLKCGKAAIPEGAKNPTVKTKILLYGTVSFKGFKFVDGAKVDVEVVNEPVVVQVQGKQFMPVSDYLKDFAKDGKMFLEYEMTLGVEYAPGENGGFYNITFNFTDLTKRLPIDDEAISTLQKFADTIEANNKAIEVKFNQALTNRNAAGPQVGDDIVEDGGNDLGNDFADDEIDEAE